MNDKNFGAMMASIGLALLAVVMLMLGRGGADSERLELPAASEVTVCYYIPDVAAPHEQTWLGGEALETALSELAALEFVSADEPDGSKMVSCLVIATNEEQITVHVDEDGRAWVFYKGRWIHEDG